MPLKISPNSHLDHGLSALHIEFLLQRFANKSGFFIETLVMPESLKSLESLIHGPSVGDLPVPESEVWYASRNNRPGKSRMCARHPRMSRIMTVIAGPRGNEPCSLYTAFGGPSAPREPFDSSLRNDVFALAESKEFWKQHALSGTR